MRLLHLADLHLGKRVNEFRMLPDQQYILKQILEYLETEPMDGVLIAGDVYDKTVPAAEAVQVFDWFLTELVRKQVPVFVISGNHDSAERLSFGAAIMEHSGVHIAQTFDGRLTPISLEDAYGPVDIYLLPFLRPAQVSVYYPEEKIATYEDAIQAVLDHTTVDRARRNVLVAHQFVTATGTIPEESDSEYNSLGGLDKVDCQLLSAFDYVALGHLHGPQKVGRDTIRYAGSPLKYSFSEIYQKKSMTVVELNHIKNVTVQQIPLIPKHDMRRIQGPLEQLLSKEIASQADTEDYLHVVLTDKEEIIDAIGKVRRVYPNVMQLDFEKEDKVETLEGLRCAASAPELPKLFQEFYMEQNQKEPTKEQTDYVKQCLEGLGGEWQ